MLVQSEAFEGNGMWTNYGAGSFFDDRFSTVRPSPTLVSTAGCSAGTDAVVFADWSTMPEPPIGQRTGAY
jgi:hypothetical protein